MIRRALEASVADSLSRFPVVGLLGARQVGKTTLAKRLAAQVKGTSVYLDLERPSDLARLSEPELYLRQHSSELVILDEVQRRPDLFPVLRSLVDEERRPGRFLVLGSASPDLLRTTSESLAERIVYHELPPLTAEEAGLRGEKAMKLWSRGGFPLSFLAGTDAASLEWREAFMATYLERDVPKLGIRVSATTLRRFWQMLAHAHGQLWNASKIAGSLGVSAPSARHYLDILEDSFLVRQLQPYFPNLKKRIVKSPKVYVRDSGLLHALLGLATLDDLLGHPVAGPSWEGWVIEQILAAAPKSWKPWFYRTGAGAEIDLVLEQPGKRSVLAFEIKFSVSPAPSKGFWSALEDLKGARGFVICRAAERYPIGKGVFALPVDGIRDVFAEYEKGGGGL